MKRGGSDEVRRRGTKEGSGAKEEDKERETLETILYIYPLRQTGGQMVRKYIISIYPY